MDATSYKFSDEEIFRLKQYRDNQKDHRLRLRFIVLLLLSVGTTIENITTVTKIGAKTIQHWFNQYITKGIDCLNSFQYKSKQPFLTENQIQEVINWVKTTNPAYLKQIRAYITYLSLIF